MFYFVNVKNPKHLKKITFPLISVQKPDLNGHHIKANIKSNLGFTDFA